MNHIPPSLRISIFLLVIVALAACGSDDPAPEQPEDDGITSIETATQNDIPSAVSEAGLETLTRLLEETGLADSLHGEGPYTLFAPSDEAFASLDGGTDSPEITNTLAYHIIPGRFETSSLAGTMDINTLQGGTVTFVAEGAVSVRDALGATANLVTPDMNVDNGVIHIIDRVLTPPAAAPDSTE